MNENFKSQHVTRTGEITLHAPPEQVFPLFGPVREAEWAEGWEPHIIYAETALAEEEGAVFITEHPGEAETIWVIVRYDPAAYHVEYARITPGSTAARVIIHCRATPGGETTAQVTYQITTLGEQGSRLVEMHYPHMMAHWEEAINRALAAH